MKTYEEVMEETAQRLGLSEKQVRAVMIDFFNALKTSLENPEEFFYKGILLDELFKIRLNPAKVMRTWMFLVHHKKRLTMGSQKNINLFKLLEDYDQYSKKQKEAIKDFREGHHDPYEKQYYQNGRTSNK